MDFKIDLSIFRGPLDLLLYLVKKQEVDITDIPVAKITDQYLEYLAVLEQLDVNDVGEFIAMASLLIEIKSQQVLPRADEIGDQVDDPREELVERLLEYKKFRDAANELEDQSREWQQRYARQANDLPARQRDPAEEPIREVELWDLVSAFGLILRDTAAIQPSSIIYDDTPIHVFMARVHARVLEEGRIRLRDFFEPGMYRSTQIGFFLAVLELVRHDHLLVEQEDLFGEIWLLPHLESMAPLDLGAIDNYDHASERAA